MKRVVRFALVFIALAGLVLLVGCDEAGTSDSGGGGGGSASLRVNNNSSYTVWYLYVRPSTSSSWGPDQLGASTTISPGGSFLLTNIPAGINYDLRADSSSGNWTRYGVPMTSGGTFTWNLVN